MDKSDLQNHDRRNFLRTVPVAAAASLAFIDASMFSAIGVAQGQQPDSGGSYALITWDQLQADIKAEGTKADKTLWSNKDFEVVLSTETAFQNPEYEWHDYRDHVIYVLEGSTTFEIGGTPRGTHKLSPGQWLAPVCLDARKVTLKKGDTLIIPRGTVHRRTSTGMVTFTLTVPKGPVPAA